MFRGLILGKYLEDSAVDFVVTVLGKNGVGIAFIAECGIFFLLMMMVLITVNSKKLMRLTPYLAGIVRWSNLTGQWTLDRMGL